MGFSQPLTYKHTHFLMEFEKRGIRVISNQRGYIVPDTISKKGTRERFDAGETIQVQAGRCEKDG